MRYRYPRARGGISEDRLRVILHTSSLLRVGQPQLERLGVLVEFQQEPGLLFWRTAESFGSQLPLVLQNVPSLSYEPAQPDPLSEFTVVISHEHGEVRALGFSRWDDETLDEVFGAPTSSPRYTALRENLLALEASEAVSGSLFVTTSEDLLAHREWLQDRMPVFIVGLAEALYFLDISLKRRGVYAYRPSLHVKGEQGYYFQRVCNTIPNFPPAWTTSLMGDRELQSGQAVQRYLESFHLSPHFPFRLKAKLERRQICGFNSNFSSDIGAQSL